MATDDRPTGEGTPKRRGKAPTITLEASEVVQPAAAVETPAAPDMSGSGDGLVAAADTPPEGGRAESGSAAADADTSARRDGEPASPSAEAGSEPAKAASVVEPPSQDHDGTFHEPPPRVMPEAAEAPRPPLPAPNQGPGFGRLVAAGIIGALLTGGLGIAAQRAGLLPGPNGDRLEALQARLDDVSGGLRDLGARPAPAMAPVDLAPVAGRLDALDAARAGLESRISALEQRPVPDTPSVTPSGSAPAIDIAAVNREIAALKVAVEAIASAQRNQAASTAAASAPVPAAPTVDPGLVDGRIRAAVAPQLERLAGLEVALATLRREVEAAAAAGKTAEARIAAIDATRERASDMGQRAALVVAVGSLRAAVERGAPFAPELRTALALGLPAEAARPLSVAADRGLPSQGQIAQRFATLAPALVKAAPAPAAAGSLFERIAAGAQSLVRIRPIGEAAGDDVPTIVSRIEARLSRGDLAGGLADFDRLPEPVRAIGASWAAEARSRHAADEALRRLSGDAVQSLTGG